LVDRQNANLRRSNNFDGFSSLSKNPCTFAASIPSFYGHQPKFGLFFPTNTTTSTLFEPVVKKALSMILWLRELYSESKILLLGKIISSHYNSKALRPKKD